MAARRLSLTAAGMLCAWGLLLASAGTPAVASTLPDGRVYEMVSPVDKNGGQIDGGVKLSASPPQQAAEDGNSITYGSQTAFAGAEDGLETVQYLSRRGAYGWVTEPVVPRQDPPVASGGVGHITPGGNVVQGTDADSLYQYFTPDLAHGLLVAGDPAPVAGAAAGYFNPYERETGSGGYRLLSGATPAFWEPGIGRVRFGFDVGFAGSSADGSHVIFAANDALTPEAVPGHINLYEAVGGELRLVSILPNGSVDPGEIDQLQFGAGFSSVSKDDEQPFGGNFAHAISSDGSRIFWTGSDRQLYVRENGTVTIHVSASQKTNGTGAGGTDPSGPHAAEYQWASSNGSVVYFTSSEQLTNDSTAVAPNAADLYRYDVGTGELSDLTVDHNAGDPNGAEVANLLGASEDGSYVYFAADGALAGTAQFTNGGSIGPLNIYVWHEGSIKLIATTSEENNTNPETRPWIDHLDARTSRVSPNGRYLAFDSRRKLTGHDNAGFMEVYEYDAQTGRLVCASCNPTGAAPTGNSTTPRGITRFHEPGWQTDMYQQRYLLDDGRLFFDSEDALVPIDTNGVQDVYEYENGRISLISSGTGESGGFFHSSFIDASASGSDVFFVTADKLLPQDIDGALDLYDARVNGGFPRLSAPVCSGTGCQGVPPAVPIFATPASVTFSGVGNFTSEPSLARGTPKIARRHKPRRHGGNGKHRHRHRGGRSSARKHG